MFSGIIQAQGVIRERVLKAGVTHFKIESVDLSSQEKVIGNSIAVNGCCVTVTASSATDFSVDCSEETLKLTNFCDLQIGDSVNIEAPITLQTALHGHIVLGHVDGLGTYIKAEQKGESFVLEVGVPADLMRYMAKKGSVAINGISLTINQVLSDSIVLMIIPHTWKVTNLSQLKSGAIINLEIDMIARYLERLLLSGVTPAV